MSFNEFECYSDKYNFLYPAKRAHSSISWSISEEISFKNPSVNTSHVAIRRLTCGWCSQRYPHRVPGGLGTFFVKGLLIVTAEEMTGSWGAYSKISQSII